MVGRAAGRSVVGAVLVVAVLVTASGAVAGVAAGERNTGQAGAIFEDRTADQRGAAFEDRTAGRTGALSPDRGVAGGVAATQEGTPTGNGTARPTVVQTVTLDRTPALPGTVDAVFSYSVPADVESFVVTIPAVRQAEAVVSDAGGFTRIEEGIYAWNGSGESRIRLSMTLSRRTFGSGQRGVDRGDWAFLESPDPTVTWEGDGPDPTLDRRFRALGEGVVTEGYAYLGPHETYRRQGRNETIHLVVPEAASPQVDPGRIASLLVTASYLVEYGGRSEAVYGFALPTRPISVEGTLGTTVEDSFWVQDTDSPDSPDTAWTHEYLHTREAFELEAETSWLSEAVAEYYTGAVAVNADRVRLAATRSHFADLGASSHVLTRPDEWPANALVSYRKGQRLAAALDARLRRETDGAVTLTDLIRRLNSHEGPVSHRDVLGEIKALSDRETATWFDRYATTAAVAPVPVGPHTYTLGQRRDPDGDGLNNAIEQSIDTDPFRADTDRDGLSDGRERRLGTHPRLPDSDGDGLVDGTEVESGTDPLRVDSDGDGTPDGAELADEVTTTERDPTPTVRPVRRSPSGIEPPTETAPTATGTRTRTPSDGAGPGFALNAALVAVALLAALALVRARRD